MTCPNCNRPVPMMAFWKATGLSGVVCPRCNFSFQPVPWRSAVIFFLAGLAGYFEGSLLKAAGYPTALQPFGVVVATFLVYAALGPFLLRFRVKEDGTLLLPHSKS